jgi:predicted MFS family arabinose efflux permease
VQPSTAAAPVPAFNTGSLVATIFGIPAAAIVLVAMKGRFGWRSFLVGVGAIMVVKWAIAWTSYLPRSR